ncbi:MAG: hypothetical protein VKO39_03415 [Cyanobacteriota bacterium]|nr:hypothetical protein [Cyanobacteriota bacterium]
MATIPELAAAAAAAHNNLMDALTAQQAEQVISQMLEVIRQQERKAAREEVLTIVDRCIDEQLAWWDEKSHTSHALRTLRKHILQQINAAT